MSDNKPSMYEALSHSPVRAAGNEVNLNIYRDGGKPVYGKFDYKAPTEGLVQVDRESGKTEWTDEFEIAWTKQGDKGPLVLMIHGVPCNRAQWEEVQRLLAPFCETICIDMLGMGESSMPRRYGEKIGTSVDIAIPAGKATQWDWVNDVDYVEKLMQHEYPGRKFILIADDWGSGIASHYAAIHNDRLLGLIQADAIAFDGYPVNEIQAIGRGAMIPNTPEGDEQFAMLFAAYDQTVVQINKTMVHNPAVYNQYKVRLITFPYVEQDYERNSNGDGVSGIFRSTTARLNFHNIRVLADRAAALSPALLLPYHPEKQPLGVQYDKITVPSLIMWGEDDNMMPAAQTQRFAYVMGTDDVTINYVPRAGHFAHTDNPLYVADTIVNFIRRVVGRSSMGDINLGHQGIWKGDEAQLINDLRRIYDLA